MEERIRYTLTFSKKGILKYISHLDLVNVFDRALRRARVPVYYSKGFNPKIKLSFEQARRLGDEIEADVLRIYLTRAMSSEALRTHLNNVLPQEIRIHDITQEEATTAAHQKRT